MEHITKVIAAIVFGVMAVVCNASDLTVVVKSADQQPGRSQPCQFFDDALVVEIWEKPRLRTSMTVCSSYGHADAKVVKDRRGRNFLLLESAEGRGSNATTGYLHVYYINTEADEIMRLPVSSAAGPTSRWKYAYDIQFPEQGGLRLRLTRRIEGVDAEDFPRDLQRQVDIDVGR